MTLRTNLFPGFALLIVLGGLTYINSLANDFVFDDTSVIRDNYYIKHSEFLSSLLDKSYFKYFGEQSYRPFVTLTYFLDFQLWKMSPFGYHLDNLILHLANSVGVWLFLGRLFSFQSWTLFAAAVFTVHPIMTETVNALGFREELLTVLCTWVSLYLFLKIDSNPKTSGLNLGFLLLSLGAFGAGLLAKENMLIFPILVAMIYVWIKRGNLRSLNFKFYAFGMSGIWLAYVFLRFYWFRNETQHDLQTPDLFSRISSSAAILGYYFKLWFFPLPLTADYTFPDSADTEWIRSSISFLVITAVTFEIYKKGSSPLRFGWFWFLIALLPTMNIYPVAHPIAERYLYFPWVGGCVVVSLWIGSLNKVLRDMSCSWIGWAAPVWILVCFSLLTLNRNSDWKTSNNLWLQNIRVMPKSSRALNGIGIYYLEQENYPLAITSFRRSAEIDPKNQRAISNLGLAYHKATKNLLAEEVLERGLTLNSRNTRILINLGKVKEVLGKKEEGLKLLDQAISQQPHWGEPYLARGNLFIEMKRYDEAYQDFLKASQIRPDYPEPWNNMGALLGQQKKFAGATLAFREALKIDPQNKEASLNLAMAYYFLKDYENARKYAKLALELDVILPDFLSPLMKF